MEPLEVVISVTLYDRGFVNSSRRGVRNRDPELERLETSPRFRRE
jgi:hypothetical protein